LPYCLTPFPAFPACRQAGPKREGVQHFPLGGDKKGGKKEER